MIKRRPRLKRLPALNAPIGGTPTDYTHSAGAEREQLTKKYL